MLRTSDLRTAGTIGMVFNGSGHVVISPDGRLAAITNGTITPREILVVDLAKRRMLWRKGTATDDIRMAGFTADSQFLAVASDNGRVR
ncbi:MAG: hypothetical protein AB7K09_03375 [Planctomycetota bacterium]